jgi:GNAT superfamily N-acetyltransferase
VRAARASDATGLARIQVESWLVSLAGLVPDEVLSELASAEAAAQFTERWRDAIANPPSSRHRVHIAVDPGSGSAPVSGEGGTASMTPVGFASAGPATDADKWPGADAELYELHVLPDADDPGHGARLLHAVADTLAEDGFHTACTWALSEDSPRLEFLESAGWAPDGAHSNLDMGVKVHVVRLHTLLSPAAG